MNLQPVQTDKAPAAIGPYSQGIAVGHLLYVSGQLGLDPESGDLVAPDFDSQAHQSLENLKQIVTAGGSDMQHVAQVDVYITHMGNFSTFNEIYKEYFGEHRPARCVVEVSHLPKGAAIEVKCVAIRP